MDLGGTDENMIKLHYMKFSKNKNVFFLKTADDDCELGSLLSLRY